VRACIMKFLPFKTLESERPKKGLNNLLFLLTSLSLSLLSLECLLGFYSKIDLLFLIAVLHLFSFFCTSGGKSSLKLLSYAIRLFCLNFFGRVHSVYLLK